MFTQEMKNAHPAPFPIALVERVVSSTNAQIILDPFVGSRTKAIATIMNNRNYVGIELSKEYFEKNEKKNNYDVPLRVGLSASSPRSAVGLFASIPHANETSCLNMELSFSERVIGDILKVDKGYVHQSHWVLAL